MDKNIVYRLFNEGDNYKACKAAGMNFSAAYSQLVSELGAGRITSPEFVTELMKLRGRILIGESDARMKSLPPIEAPAVAIESFDDLLTKASGLSVEYKERAFEYAVRHIRNRLFMEPCEHFSTGLGRIIEEGIEESFGFYKKHVEMIRAETALWAKGQYSLENIKRIAQWEASLEKPNQLILRIIDDHFIKPKTQITEQKKLEYLDFILYHLKGEGYLD
jgi:hypothetical protein